jgi:hypothetical protein
MPTSEYKYKERYFLEVTNIQMETILSNSETNHPILEQLGFPTFDNIPQNIKDMKSIIDSIKLKHVLMHKAELENGNWGVAIQITPYDYWIKPSSAVHNRLTKEFFDAALQYYEVTEFLTKEEYLNLNFKTI